MGRDPGPGEGSVRKASQWAWTLEGHPEVGCSGDSVRKLPTQILGPCLVHVKPQRMFVE